MMMTMMMMTIVSLLYIGASNYPRTTSAAGPRILTMHKTTRLLRAVRASCERGGEVVEEEEARRRPPPGGWRRHDDDNTEHGGCRLS